MARTTFWLCALVWVAVAGGCSSSATAPSTNTRHALLVAAPPIVMRECTKTARAVGYPVPCPTRLLPGMPAFGGDPSRGPRCQSQFIAPATCAPAWRGWVVGSSAVGIGDPAGQFQHLVIVASPHPIRNYARVVNGPAWYPEASERLGGWLTVGPWHARWVAVPPATNDGSAFAGHIVLVWATAGHTYAAGFHNISGERATKQLDTALIRGLRLVEPTP